MRHAPAQHTTAGSRAWRLRWLQTQQRDLHKGTTQRCRQHGFTRGKRQIIGTLLYVRESVAAEGLL